MSRTKTASLVRHLLTFFSAVFQTQDASVNVPRGMISSYLIGTTSGLVMVIVSPSTGAACPVSSETIADHVPYHP